MDIKVKMNKVGVKKIKQSQVVALKKTAMKMYAEKVDDQQIPFNEGTLQNIMTDVDDSAAYRGKVSIVSEGPYAERLYYHPEYNFNKEFNVNAQGEWWEDWLTGSKSGKAKEIFEHFYKKASGGFIE